jgi:hypothetical protein
MTPPAGVAVAVAVAGLAGAVSEDEATIINAFFGVPFTDDAAEEVKWLDVDDRRWSSGSGRGGGDAGLRNRFCLDDECDRNDMLNER